MINYNITETNITNLGQNTEEMFELIFFPVISSVGHQILIAGKHTVQYLQ